MLRSPRFSGTILLTAIAITLVGCGDHAKPTPSALESTSGSRGADTGQIAKENAFSPSGRHSSSHSKPGKEVDVQSYTRKDGIHVKAYTRSAPR